MLICADICLPCLRHPPPEKKADWERPPASLMREELKGDNHGNHAGENQQRPHGFSDPWPGRTWRRSGTGGLRGCLQPHHISLGRRFARLRFRRSALASHLLIVSAVNL